MVEELSTSYPHSYQQNNRTNVLKPLDRVYLVMIRFSQGEEREFECGGLHMEQLKNLLSKLNESDTNIIKQIYSIIYRYLEKRGRL